MKFKLQVMAKQIALPGHESKNFKMAYGGELLKTRAGRERGRPLATKQSMHLVLRSSKAKGAWSFKIARNDRMIRQLTQKFAKKYGVKVLGLANVGNHLHYQVQLTHRHTYKAFIRALTGSIAMAVSGRSRWSKTTDKLRFWDYRPFTRIVIGFRAKLKLADYLQINAIESFGHSRSQARFLIAWQQARSSP
jgi:putative transposase